MEDYFTCHSKKISKNGCTHLIFNFFSMFFFLKENDLWIQKHGSTERSNPVLLQPFVCGALPATQISHLMCPAKHWEDLLKLNSAYLDNAGLSWEKATAFWDLIKPLWYFFKLYFILKLWSFLETRKYTRISILSKNSKWVSTKGIKSSWMPWFRKTPYAHKYLTGSQSDKTNSISPWKMCILKFSSRVLKIRHLPRLSVKDTC